ncbi:MAG TPA: hypothetical protein VFU68_08530 [Terracidiphilus sp.]|nr:hypothetical protein [Terracidiphilus sp.]
MASLESVRQKIDHAKWHRNLLYTESSGYIRSNPGEMVANPDGDPNTFIYRQKEVVPARIGLLVGDCMQNLRSAFDYLIWELVLAAGNTPTDRHMFPSCLTERSFKDALRGRRLKGITYGAKALVQSLQPYTHTNPAEHWLAILDELSNINKHRKLFLTSLSSFSVSGLLDQLNRLSDTEFIGVIHETTSGGVFTAEQVNMQGDLMAFIAFDEGTVKGMDVGILVENYIGLTSTAIEAFEQFFV